MALYDRLIGLEEPKIPIHAFHAALGEVERGKMPVANLAALFGLDAGEQAAAASLASRVVTPQECHAIGGFVSVANVGATYDAVSASRGLGTLMLQTAGIVRFDFSVQVNKVGTGTQSWQLWNETDAAEVAVLTDAGGAGNRTLATTVSFAALPAGLKRYRVRAKSTIAGDDPLYYGATLVVYRWERLTSQELHEVLLLAESRVAYATAAAIQTRLGT